MNFFARPAAVGAEPPESSPESTDLGYVVLSRMEWESPLGTNARDIARELALTHRVLFVNPPLDWNTRYFGKRPGTPVSRQPRLVQPNLWVLDPPITLASINWLPDNRLYDWLNHHNNRRVAGVIRRALGAIGLERFVLFNDNEMLWAFYLKELLHPTLSVYYLRDNMLALPFWQRHGARLEPLLLAKSDVVVGNSAYLAQHARQFNAWSFDIGQGCDFSKIAPDADHPVPADLRALPRPTIGYIGALSGHRIDADLLAYVARTRPDWSIVLIGPNDVTFDWSALKPLPNVHWLGPKRPEEVSAYLQHLDVLVNPQLFNEVTNGNYPRKIDEYLAMGKPVVARRTTAMEPFRQHVLLAEDGPAFVRCLDQALTGQYPADRAERIRFAREHTWANSVGQLQEAVHQRLRTVRREVDPG
jgi:teichuronic acid biosynthesis glycosyltransferase TuaH